MRAQAQSDVTERVHVFQITTYEDEQFTTTFELVDHRQEAVNIVASIRTCLSVILIAPTALVDE